MRKLALFIFCVIPFLFYSQVQEYTPKVRLAMETYAFLKGQSAALEMVSRQFPALKPDVKEAEKKLVVLFKPAEQNIEHFLKDELGDSDFNILGKRIDSLLNKQLKIPIEKEKYARDFIAKVRERSRIISDTLLLKGIMSFAYHNAPHKEVTDGHVKIFTTKDHPKAEKTALKIPIPKSWVAEEAEMPETIKQFTSYCGYGSEKMLIVVYDLPAEQYNFILNEKSISEILSPQTNLIRSELVTIDGRQGMMIEVEETLDHTYGKMKIRMLQFMFVENQKLYCLQGSIGPVEVDENLELQIKKYEPLFRIIAFNTQIDN